MQNESNGTATYKRNIKRLFNLSKLSPLKLNHQASKKRKRKKVLIFLHSKNETTVIIFNFDSI